MSGVVDLSAEDQEWLQELERLCEQDRISGADDGDGLVRGPKEVELTNKKSGKEVPKDETELEG
jgi:hypothetical protein